jgi:CheY-like chemotaxis protein
MDDDESVLEVTSEILRAFGYEVECVGDGLEALSAYRRSMLDHRRFDLVIMDLTVPAGMGGKEAVKELLKLDPTAKAIVSSGHSADPIVANFRAYGFVGVIPKPYRVAALDAIIKKALTA